MTNNIKIFIESNISLLEEHPYLFVCHAYEQLTNVETRDLMSILQYVDIDIKYFVDSFIRDYIKQNIGLFNDFPLQDLIEEIPPFHKTKYELSDIVANVADEEGYDITYDEENLEWIERRI